MYCSSCGNILEEDANFCPKCGNKTSNILSLSNSALPSSEMVINYVQYLQAVLSVEELCMFWEKMLKDSKEKLNFTQINLNSAQCTKIVIPECPKKPLEYSVFDFVINVIFSIIGGFILSFLCSWIFYIGFGEKYSYWLITIIIGSFFSLCMFPALKDIFKKTYAEQEKKYYANLAIYNEKINQQKSNKEKINTYQKVCVNLKKNICYYESEVEKANKSRKELYDKDILFPTYQNATACYYFLQYFLSGRCSTLSGYSGAYNRFELEKRLDTIIDELATIIKKLNDVIINLADINRSMNTQLDHLRRQNSIIDNLTQNIMQNNNLLVSEITSQTKFMDDIKKLQTLQIEQQKKYQDYTQFAIKQKRYEEGHLY